MLKILWLAVARISGTSQVVLVVENPPADSGRCKKCGFNCWVGKIPWRRVQQANSVFLPGESHEQRILMGYGPQGQKELDTTEAT